MTENSWCGSLPTQPRLWDPTRISIAMECWRKHWLQTIRGLRRNGPTNVHLEWGKAKHACDEEFDRYLLSGLVVGPESHLAAQRKALELAKELSWDAELNQPKWGEYLELFQCTDPPTRPHKKDPSKLVQNKERCPFAKEPVFEIALGPKGKCKNCGHDVISMRQWVNYHPKKTHENLLLAVMKYCTQEETVTPYRFPDGTPSVEIQARLPLPLISPDEIDDIAFNGTPEGFKYKRRLPYELLVNIDSIVEWLGELAIRERKTTGVNKLDAKYWRQFEFNPQIDSYDLVASVLYANPKTGKLPKIMVEVTRITAKGEVDIVRQLIHIPEERREEWLRELQKKIKEAEQKALAVAAGADSEVEYDRNPKACHGMHGTCAYFALCVSPSSEREGIIANDYHVERWDPLAAESFVEGERE